MKRRLLIPVLTCFIAVGCGGGSGEPKSPPDPIDEVPVDPPPAPEPPPETPPTPELKIELGEEEILIAENSQVLIPMTVSYNGESVIEFSVLQDSQATGIDYSVDETGLTIVVSTLEQDGQAEVTVVAKAGDLSSEDTLAIQLQNSSAQGLLEEGRNWTSVQTVFPVAELKAVGSYFGAIAYLDKKLTYTEWRSFVADFHGNLDSSLLDADNAPYEDLQHAIEDYLAGNALESRVAELLGEVKTFSQSKISPFLQRLSEVAQLTEEKLSPLPLNELRHSHQYDAFSLLIGNPELGQFTDGQWVFFEAYAYLEKFSPVLNPDTHCDVSEVEAP